jgi:hypothetical protein
MTYQFPIVLTIQQRIVFPKDHASLVKEKVVLLLDWISCSLGNLNKPKPRFVSNVCIKYSHPLAQSTDSAKGVEPAG